MRRVLITGGAGFIGSALVRNAVLRLGWQVLNVDKLTYAGNLESLVSVENKPNYTFLKADICDRPMIRNAIAAFQPDCIVNLAAESHVDRSISKAESFIKTNIIGTYRMLECALEYYKSLDAKAKARFRFHQVSTDEVYGSLGEDGWFTEETAYDPSSPYSASKASADHIARAWHRTFGLPVTISNCSNNYGPYQYPEKLIPLMISNALNGKELPVYGTGKNVRDWLYVDDHVWAIIRILETGRIGQTYNVGGGAERKNIDIVHLICDTLDDMRPRTGGQSYRRQIKFVADRLGHDFRYAIDSGKIEKELGWKATESFESGIRKTIEWYVANQEWCNAVSDKKVVSARKTSKG